MVCNILGDDSQTHLVTLVDLDIVAWLNRLIRPLTFARRLVAPASEARPALALDAVVRRNLAHLVLAASVLAPVETYLSFTIFGKNFSFFRF
jgi:hypothetical protein